jgi:tetratricopeptide (TPR) repeat protein
MLAQNRGDYAAAEQLYMQSLEIEERLGNKAGLATSYHQLGNLAHLRGDNAAAEQRYTQELEIRERLGNQADLATSYATLASISSERGNDIEAVSYELRALSIWMQTGVNQTSASLQRLAEARERLGNDAFRDSASRVVDDASLQALDRLLD